MTRATKAKASPKAEKRPADGGSAPRAAARAKPSAATASEPGLVEARIRDLGGWQGETLAQVRRLIRAADPAVVEQVKWRKPSNPAGVPVWSHGGILCTGESYKAHVRLTFHSGAALPDPSGLFNANLVGVRRAIQLREGDRLDEAAFKALVRAAVAHNTKE